MEFSDSRLGGRALYCLSGRVPKRGRSADAEMCPLVSRELHRQVARLQQEVSRLQARRRQTQRGTGRGGE